MIELVLVMLAVQTKHLLLDWIWQPPWEWRNKGTYGHAGGLFHAGKNGAGTAVCMVPLCDDLASAFLVLFADALVHYHVDWVKMNINRRMGWTATTHNEFWQLTGLDQWAHQVTYLAILAALI
jgi:hypothetical protein